MPKQRPMAGDSVVDHDGLNGIIENGTDGSAGGFMLPDRSAGSFAALESQERYVEQEFLHAAAHARMICDLYWQGPSAAHAGARDQWISALAVWVKAFEPMNLGNN